MYDVLQTDSLALAPQGTLTFVSVIVLGIYQKRQNDGGIMAKSEDKPRAAYTSEHQAYLQNYLSAELLNCFLAAHMCTFILTQPHSIPFEIRERVMEFSNFRRSLVSLDNSMRLVVLFSSQKAASVFYKWYNHLLKI